ncbi:hypothetical protein D3C77_782920 [compost metagenome]
MYTQFTGTVEQQNERAATDQATLAQLGTGQGAQYLVGFVHPGDQLAVGSRPVGGLVWADSHHQPCDSS